MSTPEIHMKVDLVAVDKIIPYERNAKLHTPEQTDSLVKSIQAHGWDQPIVVDKHMVIIKGHGRRLAALKMGLKRVPVLVRADLTPDQVKAARLADNRVAMGDYDTELLQSELTELAGAGVDLTGIFSDKELSFLTADLGAMNPDAMLEDLATSVNDQSDKNDATAAAVAAKEVPIAAALGFKAVPGEAERVVSHFMAIIEGGSGLKGADAFVAFANSVVKTKAGA